MITIDPEICHSIIHTLREQPDWASLYIEELAANDPFLATFIVAYINKHGNGNETLLLHSMLLIYKLIETQQEINELETIYAPME